MIILIGSVLKMDNTYASPPFSIPLLLLTDAMSSIWRPPPLVLLRPPRPRDLEDIRSYGGSCNTLSSGNTAIAPLPNN